MILNFTELDSPVNDMKIWGCSAKTKNYIIVEDKLSKKFTATYKRKKPNGKLGPTMAILGHDEGVDTFEEARNACQAREQEH